MTGVFITFEGPEGAGKSTQLALVAGRLKDRGVRVTTTREPGGTKGGEAIRSALLDPDAAWSPLAEALLMNAARDAHLRTVILPALSRGDVVLCDRFALSTRAYQGGGGGLPTEELDALEKAVVTRHPDLAIVFDLSPEDGLARAASRGAADRFEQKGAAYHRAVAAAFRTLAETTAYACRLDASGSPGVVTERLMPLIDEALAERKGP